MITVLSESKSNLRSNSEIKFCLVNLLVRSRDHGVECELNPSSDSR